MPVMRYHGVDGQYHSFTNMTNIRTLFWVLKDTPTRYSSILGDNNQYHFHPENNKFWHSSHTSGNVKNGALWQNGVSKTGHTDNKPTTYAVLSMRTSGNIEGSNFYSDRGNGGRTFKGDLAELLIYSAALTDTEIRDIEGKLSWKWGLQGDLVSGHPHAGANPNMQEFNQGGEQATVTFAWGDDNGTANGNTWDHTQVLSGTHDIGVVSHDLTGLTKGATYYFSTKVANSGGDVWAPTKTFVPANTLLNKNTIPDLVLWLDATDVDANGNADTVTDGTALATWGDKSNANTEVKQTVTSKQPVYKTNQFGSKPGIRFDGAGGHFFVNGAIRSAAGGVSAYVVSKRDAEGGDAAAMILDEASWDISSGAGNDPYATMVKKYSNASQTITNVKIGKDGATSSYDFKATCPKSSYSSVSSPPWRTSRWKVTSPIAGVARTPFRTATPTRSFRRFSTIRRSLTRSITMRR
jgi:hypothetical protein